MSKNGALFFGKILVEPLHSKQASVQLDPLHGAFV
jgi:hypothetical protein